MKDLSNENVIHIVKDGVQYLQFRRLLEYSDILVHAYSLGIDKNFRTARAKNVEPLTQEEVKKANKDYSDLCNAIEMNYIDAVKPKQAQNKNLCAYGLLHCHHYNRIYGKFPELRHK